MHSPASCFSDPTDQVIGPAALLQSCTRSVAEWRPGGVELSDPLDGDERLGHIQCAGRSSAFCDGSCVCICAWSRPAACQSGTTGVWRSLPLRLPELTSDVLADRGSRSLSASDFSSLTCRKVLEIHRRRFSCCIPRCDHMAPRDGLVDVASSL